MEKRGENENAKKSREMSNGTFDQKVINNLGLRMDIANGLYLIML